MAPKLWERLRQGLTRTRDRLEQQVGSLLSRRGPIDPETRARLEDALIEADVGPVTAERLIVAAEALMQSDGSLDLRQALERTAAERLGRLDAPFEPGPERPWVAGLVGVNGVGKTTLAGKLAASFAA